MLEEERRRLEDPEVTTRPVGGDELRARLDRLFAERRRDLERREARRRDLDYCDLIFEVWRPGPGAVVLDRPLVHVPEVSSEAEALELARWLEGMSRPAGEASSGR